MILAHASECKIYSMCSHLLTAETDLKIALVHADWEFGPFAWESVAGRQLGEDFLPARDNPLLDCAFVGATIVLILVYVCGDSGNHRPKKVATV